MTIAGFTAPEPVGLSCEHPDSSQRRVLDLDPSRSAVVVGAPGTGKTSVAVELVATRVERDGWAADDILVLTPNRLAANRLRDAVALRLARTSVVEAASGPRARTPMSLAFSIAAEQAIVRELDPVRLLTGSEQDTIINDLLLGEIRDGANLWPDDLHDDIRVRRLFRTELRELFGRAEEHGIDPTGLARLGAELGVPSWQAAARFWNDYRDTVASARPDHFDASELMSVASGALADPQVLPNVRLVILDDAHEATAGVIALLRAFARRGVAVVVLGDPDIATTTFRGAVPEFLGRVATDLEVPLASVEKIVLSTVHRHGPQIRELVSAFTTMGSALVVGQREARVREKSDDSEASDGVVSIVRDTRTSEMTAVSAVLRRAHLERGIPWNHMAVITRNGSLVATYARGLAALDVPTRSLMNEVSLQEHTVTRDMMRVVSLALGRVPLTRESAADALLSPFGGLTSLELRRLRLAFRHDRLAEGDHQPGGDVIPDALREPAMFAAFDFGPARRAARFAETLRLVHDDATRGASIEELLWTVWSRSGLATTWRSDALSSGIAADEANRNLDAVIALFTSARRFVERQPDAPAEQFISEFERADVPEDSLAAQAEINTVLVATPSGVIGAEFEVVVVAGVQENVWPNLRPRGTLLHPQRLVRHLRAQDAPTVDERREVSDDEKRMMAMALSRATSMVVVSAHDAEDDQPSPYFHRAARHCRALEPDDDGTDRSPTLRSLVGYLRRRVVNGAVDAPTAASALARLARHDVSGAHPDQWLGLKPWSTDDDVIEFDRDDERVYLSPSKLESWEKDELVWFIDSIVSSQASPASGLGTLLHGAMETRAPANVATGHVTTDEIMEFVDDRWAELSTAFEAPWQSTIEHRRATALASAIAQYLTDFDASGAQLLRNEGGFRLELDVLADAADDAGEFALSSSTADVPTPVRVTVSGKIDRVELTPDGKVVIADLKTGKSKVRVQDIPTHAQLACYQLAVHLDSVEGVPTGAQSGGAKLIFVADANAKKLYTERVQAAGDAEFFAVLEERIRSAARGMAGSRFVGRLYESEEAGDFASRYEYRIHLVRAVTE